MFAGEKEKIPVEFCGDAVSIVCWEPAAVDKTEIIMFIPQQLNNAHTINGCIFSDGGCIRFANFVKNLGFILDKHLDMDVHVNSVVSHCYKLLTDIGKIKTID